MSFVIDARTILELGKELISSEEMALFELIKNSFDAGLAETHVEIWLRLSRSDYLKLITLLEKNTSKRKTVSDFIRTKLLDLNDETSIEFLNCLQVAKSLNWFRN